MDAGGGAPVAIGGEAALKPVRTDAGILDDDRDDDRSFWGAYAVIPSRSREDDGIDLYSLGLARKSARFDQGTASERRSRCHPTQYPHDDGSPLLEVVQ